MTQNTTESSAGQNLKKVIIIGAGPAGLTAAYELLKAGGCQVTVLEESGDIGGISRTVRYHGNRMDIGGHRFFSKDDRIMNWWVNQMPLQGQPSKDDSRLGRAMPLEPGGPDPQKEDRVMLVRQRISRIFYLRRFFDYPVSLKWSTLHNLGFLRTMRAGFSYLASILHKLPEDSLENFYINRFGRVLYSMFFEHYTEKVWGRHPSKISADWGAQRVRGLSVRAILKDMLRKAFRRKKTVAAADGQKETETSLIEQFFYPKYGPGQLWEQVARTITEMGGEVRLNSRVTGLATEQEGPAAGGHARIRSVIWQDQNPETASSQPDHNGESHRLDADWVLSSMPLKDLVAGLQGAETPPPDITAIAEGLPYRDFMTVGLLVNRLSIKNTTKLPTLNHLVPDCWIYIQEPGVHIGRLQIFNNWSPYLVADPEHTVWIGLEYFSQEGDALWQESDEAFIKMAIGELVQIGILDADAVLDACRIKVRKAYPAYFGTYGQIGRLTDYLDHFANLYCIGRNGQHRYNNMDHSMLTAMLAAEQIHTGRADKAAIWQVNTEQAYHETKQAEQK
ncbi:MAG: NAD(P)/FAD-dependent oxidoreductase [Clostridiaceae bacterium]|nr:NAD(P)/FAD-dependent oxidoreductase [Clostridiaceae bacterium]